MAAQTQAVSQTEPEQTEPSGFDLIRQETRDEFRLCLARIGLTNEKAAALGLNLAALDIEDED